MTTLTSLTYIGDFEEVDDYIRNQLTKPGRFSDDPCTVDKFDAIAALRNELFIFVGKVSSRAGQIWMKTWH